MAMRRDDGAVLPLFVLLLVVLLAFSALAVDLGIGWSRDRLNQSGADTGVLAGALEWPATGLQVVAAVKDYTNRSMGNFPIASSEWDTGNCSDPDGVAGGYIALQDTSGTVFSPCISIKQANTAGPEVLLRVKLPDQTFDTTFASIVGIDTITTGAFAEAELSLASPAGILPFALPSDASLEHCIGQPPGGLARDLCTGPARGKFGTIDSPFHGTTDPGTTSCLSSSTNRNTLVEWNTALGLDHMVVEALTGADPNDGEDDCAAIPETYIPYALNIDTGFARISNVGDGLLSAGPYGTTAQKPGRLRQGGGCNGSLSPCTSGGNTLGSGDVARAVPDGNGPSVIWLDNVGLWVYLEDTGNDLDDCDPDNSGYSAGGEAATTHLEACLSAGRSGPAPSFSDDILTSPRMVLIPKLTVTQAQLDAIPGGTGLVNILEFAPVYLGAAYFNCNAGKCMKFDDISTPAASPDPTAIAWDFFAPGEGTAEGCLVQGNGCKNNVNLSLKALTGWILERDWVPDEMFTGVGDDRPFQVLLFK